MRLLDLDQEAWAQLARELDELCDRIAVDEPEGEWPANAVAVECWQAVNRAALLALFASAAPRATMAQLRGAFDLATRERAATTNGEPHDDN